MSLPQKIDWLSIIQRWEREAREGISAVEFVKGRDAVVFVWHSFSALAHYLNRVGFFRVNDLDAHLYYARKEILDDEDGFIRIYHRLDYQDGSKRIDTGWIWE